MALEAAIARYRQPGPQREQRGERFGIDVGFIQQLGHGFGVLFDAGTEQRLAHNAEGQPAHLAVKRERRIGRMRPPAGGEVGSRLIDRRVETIYHSRMKHRLHQAPLPRPELAVAGDQAFAHRLPQHAVVDVALGVARPGLREHGTHVVRVVQQEHVHVAAPAHDGTVFGKQLLEIHRRIAAVGLAAGNQSRARRQRRLGSHFRLPRWGGH